MSCLGCVYWSELMAEARGNVVVAWCLHPDRPQPDYAHRGCDKRFTGLGYRRAVDDPTLPATGHSCVANPGLADPARRDRCVYCDARLDSNGVAIE